MEWMDATSQFKVDSQIRSCFRGFRGDWLPGSGLRGSLAALTVAHLMRERGTLA